jgi:hypothetical protein
VTWYHDGVQPEHLFCIVTEFGHDKKKIDHVMLTQPENKLSSRNSDILSRQYLKNLFINVGKTRLKNTVHNGCAFAL